MTTLTSFSNQPLNRTQFLNLFDTALGVREFSYARLLALAWLTSFPGDLGVGLRHAQALVGLGLHRQAVPVLEAICQTDPEFLEAQELLAECAGLVNHKAMDEARASVVALSEKPSEQETAAAAKWGGLLRQAKTFQAKSKMSPKGGEAEVKPAHTSDYSRLVHAALLENPASPLAALAHLYFMRDGCERGEIVDDAVTSLARAYHTRWPRCLAFSLILADQLMDHGAGEEAVALLHQVAGRDVTAQVASRIWDGEHPYRNLWPEKLVIEPAAPVNGWAGPVTSPQGLPIPAAIAAALGWNQLASGSSQPSPVTVTPAVKHRKSSAALGRNRATRPLPSERKSAPASRPADYPVYVILSSHPALQQVYGQTGARRIEAAAHRLVRAVASRPDWDALAHFMPRQQAPYTPWDFKLALADLDDTLAARGERIGALLILGGPEIVPFHMLPNPVDDSDEAVPSDNPYATRDENYFVAEWPVGRLPGGAGKDPALLIESLERFTAYHVKEAASPTNSRSWMNRWGKNLVQLLRPPAFFWPGLAHANEPASYGYTAAVWQRASLSVFRPIGKGSRLKVSPPLAIDEIKPADRPQLRLPTARLAYFNLHGQRDSAVWYGQSDPTAGVSSKSEPAPKARQKSSAKSVRPDVERTSPAPKTNPDFPVALRPVDIHPGLRETNFGTWRAWLEGMGWTRPQPAQPGVVFSEACYGAHVVGRETAQAISLTFLRAGSSAFVGSTCIAYGAIAMPLTAADLLGHTFWQYLTEGFPAGEALRRAKITLSTEMDRRQGYLDGEDQKTLISFVLYGDPLYNDLSLAGSRAGRRVSKHSLHLQADAQSAAGEGSLPDWLTKGLESEPPHIHTVCDRVDGGSGKAAGNQQAAGEDGTIPPEVLGKVRQIVAKYLPGMTGANMKMAEERADCQAHGHTCPTAHLGAKGSPPDTKHPDRRVVTLSKTITCPANGEVDGADSSATITHQQFARLTLDASSKLVKLVVSR